MNIHDISKAFIAAKGTRELKESCCDMPGHYCQQLYVITSYSLGATSRTVTVGYSCGTSPLTLTNRCELRL